MSFTEIITSCAYYLLAGAIAFFVALCFDFLKSQPPEHYKKVLDAIVCACMSFAICGYTSTHFDFLSNLDCLFVSVGIGAIGAGRVTEIVLQLASRKLKVSISRDIDDEQKD